MSSEEGQKHIYAQEHQLYYYYNNFKGLLTFNLNGFSKKQLHLNGFQLFIHWLLRQRAKMVIWKTWTRTRTHGHGKYGQGKFHIV